MRNGRTAKQCVWLGADRYFGRGDRRHANADADTNCYSSVYSYAYGNGNGNGDGYVYSDAYSYGCRFANPDAKPQLLARLRDICYHWHDNSGRHRYRQPLRRLHHAGHSTVPGKRIRPCACYIDFCRI